MADLRIPTTVEGDAEGRPGGTADVEAEGEKNHVRWPVSFVWTHSVVGFQYEISLFRVPFVIDEHTLPMEQI